MKFKILFFLFTLLFFISGCYEMKQDEKGRTIKINKITGEVSVIEGDRILELKDENEIKAASKRLGEAKTWPDVPLPIADGAKASLITKWNDGNLYYQFFVNKNLRGKGNYLANLTIQLHDDASFLIKDIPIPVSSMTGELGLDGKSIKSMEAKGQVPMGEETYKKIMSWNVIWSGFDK